MLALVVTLALTSSIDREHVSKVLRTATPGFTRCYEKALRERPELRGKVLIVLEIAADGTVPSVKIELPVEAPHFGLCLTKRARRLRFGKGPTPVRVTWPLQLVPSA